MDSSRSRIIYFARREPRESKLTNAETKAADANHNEKQLKDSDLVEPVSQLRAIIAAHASRLQAIQEACSVAHGAAADLELILTDLSADSDEPVRQVRSLFASHDMDLEAVRIACECAQKCSVELLQGLEKLFAGGGR